MVGGAFGKIKAVGSGLSLFLSEVDLFEDRLDDASCG